METSTQSSTGSEAREGKQRKWSIEERQRIVQASLKNGTTVNAVAKIYGVHPSQIYDWRKQHRQERPRGQTGILLPVEVTEAAPSGAPETKQECSLVIEARSARITMSGCIDVAVLRAVLECLVQ